MRSQSTSLPASLGWRPPSYLPLQSHGNDILDGGDGSDQLYGGGGSDTLYGGAGVDWLYGQNGNDTLIGGADANSLYGGAGDDVLQGGEANDFLSGDDLPGDGGNDVLNGGGADDVITLWGGGADAVDGGTGRDTIYNDGVGHATVLFGRGDGQDIIDWQNSTGNSTTLQLRAGITATDLIGFQRIGDNLEVKVIGTSDAMTVNDWYVGSSHQLEQFKVDANKILLAADVQNLVQAMASFAPPAAGQTTLPQNYQDSLNSVIAANWH
jgi:Ca2+-binding RTX toxin-like protein